MVSYYSTYQSLAEGGRARLNTKPPKWQEHDEDESTAATICYPFDVTGVGFVLFHIRGLNWKKFMTLSQF